MGGDVCWVTAKGQMGKDLADLHAHPRLLVYAQSSAGVKSRGTWEGVGATTPNQEKLREAAKV